MRRLLLDLSPLRRYPEYRKLWSGYVLRQLGQQLTAVTVIYQIFEITHSNLDVGLISVAQLVPTLAVPMIGGAIADAVDRRKLLSITAILFSLASLGLTMNAAQHHPLLWPLYACAGATAALGGIDNPTRNATTAMLVEREALVSANALRSLVSQLSSIIGPGAAGVLIAAFHGRLELVYLIDVMSTIGAFILIVQLPALPPVGGGRRVSIASIVEGFSFLRGRHQIQGCYYADLLATILGEPVSLLPYMALVHFHGGARAFGLLSAAPAIGAGLGALFSGWTKAVKRRGFAVINSVAMWGLFLFAFGASPWLWLGTMCLAAAGWADATSAIFRSTIIQLEVPDHLRGRLSGIQTMIVSSGPRLGNVEGSLLATAIGPTFAIELGGLGCALGAALLAHLMPRFREARSVEGQLVTP